MEIARAAVVGAGTMGGGIAYLFATSGIPVILKDVDAGQLAAAQAQIEAIYRRAMERGRLADEQARESVARVAYSLSYDGFGEVDIAVEAVPEEMRIKQEVFTQLARACRPEAVLATNTSALSITALGKAAGRPATTVGMHFFNPAHVMKLVEVIPGRETASSVVERVVHLARRLGKVPVHVRECPGFLVNRLLMPYLEEAVICLEEETTSVPEIDEAMGPAGFGWPMGPFVLMDMLGLDVCHHICAHLGEAYGARMREPALLSALFEAGHLGQKSGIGFYKYPDRVPSPAVQALIARFRAEGTVGPRQGTEFSPERLVVRLMNEAFLCVEQEVACVEDVDLACVTGLGMRLRCADQLTSTGPLAYADRVGLDVVLRQLQEFAADLGARFRPAEILRRMVRAGRTGTAVGRGFYAYAG